MVPSTTTYLVVVAPPCELGIVALVTVAASSSVDSFFSDSDEMHPATP
jgi:hypothetical protein